MHGPEGEKKRRRHMRPVPAPGDIAASAPASAPLALSSPQQIPTLETSPDSFLKDGRKIQVGDCALFQAGNAPPFIGIIRQFTRGKEDYLKLCVNWLYRPADIKLAKGILLDAAPNEVFYSFHKDVIPAASLLHPCKVAFLQKGVELPSGIPSFVCRRVYDIANKRLWWLTDQDYINEHQEEVDQLLNKTWLEMHAALQSGGRSPKSLNDPTSTQQHKSGLDNIQNSGTSFPSQAKGKKRLRNDQGLEPIKGDQGIEPVKRDQGTEPINQEQSVKPDDGDSITFKCDNMKAEIAKITEKSGLVSIEGVEKLVNLMQFDRNEKKIDLAGRIMLADVIAATDRYDCLSRFVQLKGVPVLDDWLQEVHKGKTGDVSSPKESDKVVEDFLFSLLRALEKLPVNLNALQACNIGKSVNNLRTYKNLEIQKKARSLVDTWKKRVDAEMSKIIDAKSVGSSQPVSLPVKQGYSDVSHPANKRTGSTEVATKMPIARPAASKHLPSKPGMTDSTVKSILPVVVSSKELHCKTAASNGGSELPPVTVKEDNNSASSQSQCNNQSCSSDQAKTMSSSCKEEGRSSIAGSVFTNKFAGGSSRTRRSSNGLLGTSISGIQRETNSGRSGSVNKVMTSEKASQSGSACEKSLDMPAGDNGNNNRLIVRLPNPVRSPGQGASVSSTEDPLIMGSQSSSLVFSEKQDQNDRRTKRRTDVPWSHVITDANAESQQGNVFKEGLVAAEGVRLPTAIVDEEHIRNVEETGKVADPTRTSCSSSGNENGDCLTEPKISSFNSMHALIESCAKYSEASTPLAVGDDMGMNLLATVAAGEISKSDLTSPTGSIGTSPAMEDSCAGNNESKLRLSCDNDMNVQHDEAAHADSEKQGNSACSVLATEMLQQDTSNSGNAIQLQNNKLNIDPTTQSTTCYTSSPKIVDSCMKVEVKLEKGVDKCSIVSKPAEVKDEHDDDGTSVLEDKKNTVEQVSDICTDGKPNLSSSSMDEKKSFECDHKKIGDSTIDTSDVTIVDRSDPDVAAAGGKLEILLVEDPMLSPLAKEVLSGASSIDQQQPPQSDAIDESLDAVVSLPADDVPPKSADWSKTRESDNSGIKYLEFGHEAQEQNSISPCSIDEPVGSAAVSLATAETVGDLKETHESCTVGSASQEAPSAFTIKETEDPAKSSKTSGFDSSGKEELSSSAELCSLTVPVEQDVVTNLEFDLNKGMFGDDGNQGQPAISPATVYSSAIHLPSLSPFANPMSNGFPALVTVAAPAKGAFIPPENLLKTKGELGWKGSAATSAFRPAEPRKVLELPPNVLDIPPSDGSGKQGRALLDIDLNVADDRVVEDMVSQGFAQTSVSMTGIVSTHGTPKRTAGGFDLDLNRVDDGTECGQSVASTTHKLEVSLLPVRAASGGFSGGGASVRNFDLNDRPGIDEVGIEPVPRNQQANSTSNVPFLSPVASHRTNNSEFGCVSSWFSPNSYPAVAMPSFLADRGDQSNPIVVVPGSQRILGSVTGGGNLGSDIYRGPVFSSSPAMTFSSATAFSYANLPFPTSFPLASTSFSGGSTPYVDSSSGGGSSFPAFPSVFVGPAGAVSAQFPRPYLISFPEGATSSVSDNSLKWSRQRLDLNTGPRSVDMEGRDERLPSASRQLLVAASQASMEEQARMYALPALGSKRKEPDGGWDTDRSAKQLLWK